MRFILKISARHGKTLRFSCCKGEMKMRVHEIQHEPENSLLLLDCGIPSVERVGGWERVGCGLQ